MDLQEFQSKELVAQYGVPVPQGMLARTAEQAEDMARKITAERYMVKAQIKAGGRGLAGGIKTAATPSLVFDAAKSMIGQPLVTQQTGTGGEPVEAVYVEAAIDIGASFYVALALDPNTARPLLLASSKGGVEFEQSAQIDPSIVQQCDLKDATPAGIAKFLDANGFPDTKAAAELVLKMARAFTQNDMMLLEINPLVQSKDGAWMALDAKVSLDGNAMFRHTELQDLAQADHMSAAEKIAYDNNINLVQLDGNIGVVVNGAGLGLATNDLLIDAGGRPANFMDIRTTATSFDIAKGVDLILSDAKVSCLFLNVHGGGMTVCDTVAEGVAFAYARANRKPPIVARLAGQNAEWGLRILKERRLPVEVFDTMKAATARSVELAGGRR